MCQFFVNIAFLRLNRVQSKYEKNLLEKIEVEGRIQLESVFYIVLFASMKRNNEVRVLSRSQGKRDHRYFMSQFQYLKCDEVL